MTAVVASYSLEGMLSAFTVKAFAETVMVWLTGVAAAKVPFPPWVARITQEPPPVRLSCAEVTPDKSSEAAPITQGPLDTSRATRRFVLVLSADFLEMAVTKKTASP